MSATLVFCNSCDKASYTSAVEYHNNTCNQFMSGIDCMHLENDNMFCGCEVSA